MGTIKQSIIVPGVDYKPANLPFGVISGTGVDNYSKDGKEFSITIALGKKETKEFKKEVMNFWTKNKGDGTDKPKNFNTMVKQNKKGDNVIYVKSATEFESGDANEIAIVDAKKNPLDPGKFGIFGGESEGRVIVGLAIYPSSGTPVGVSRFIQAVQLTKFEKGGSSKVGMFGEEESEGLAGHIFGEEEPKENKKKKNKKKKK